MSERHTTTHCTGMKWTWLAIHIACIIAMKDYHWTARLLTGPSDKTDTFR